MLSQVTSSACSSPVREVGIGPATIEMDKHVVVEITSTASADEARRISFEMARQASFDDSVADRAALIATEAATNILRYAEVGQILCRVVGGAEPAVEIIALDDGPGIAHLSAAMRGGYSTSGAPGHGLRGMSRASNVFDIYSRPGQGTAILAQVWARSLRYYATTRDYASPRVKTGAISMAGSAAIKGSHSGERLMGEAWVTKHQASRSLIMIVSALGQGEVAARTAAEAARVINEVHRLSPAEILEIVHEALEGTRGASVAVAEIRLSNGSSEIRFAGVGNIAARVLTGGGYYHLGSLHGIIGYEAEIEEFTYPWAAHSTLVMHSDGMSSSWNTEDYPGLLASHPELIAAVLHRDFGRGLDDATVVVAK